MPHLIEADTVGLAWTNLLRQIQAFGKDVKSRGLEHREITNVVWHVTDARNNLLVHPLRKLSYRFAVAEWLWIWFGHNDVETISKYNPNIAKFSDDGFVFAGAYGPWIEYQYKYIFETLRNDLQSRQAVLQIFSANPRSSKDIPCTLTVQFLIRNDKLHTTVNMRSSDIWLGLPYDVFNFSMIANILSFELSMGLGSITFNLGSSHLYKIDKDKAFELTKQSDYTSTLTPPYVNSKPPAWLDKVLKSKEFVTFPRPYKGGVWTTYARVLVAKSNQEAYNILKGDL
jgi:thymidylate synthase